MLRLITYNVRRCLGTDGTLSPARIAAVLASCRPDVVALQELDVGRPRSGRIDQAHAIAEHLGMRAHFHAALRVMEEAYGNAILTALPSRLVRAEALPGLAGRPHLEPRGALWAAIEAGGTEVQVIATHLGLRRRERARQAEALLGPRFLADPGCRPPLVLVGDLNAVPASAAYRRLARHLRDAQRAAGVPRRQRTFPSGFPLLRLDHVFVSEGIRVRHVEVVRGPLARVASDHLPLLVDLDLAPAAGAPRPDRAEVA
ncbi:Endonuclease/exonuclease/phosphatase [Methylobacterium sp. 4-46]|uniref:endonuclease/exonuclease/phosphatase family protein n=1 Tax=unclassified Methylobacterium TaxID=2615210 RepID=UPI000165C9F5|nr:MULTISPECIES: endonuclease/exonuclease/phosphatase family protein [Methylobacterium]ACA15450.1 Endonuclease/exonuclease/phosphatase [Methylobacterium sp. 4-46]WFT81169.1 endonuclease/exonuclease/phosphatase family protein [Methylobacterium nodulans]